MIKKDKGIKNKIHTIISKIANPFVMYNGS